MQIKKNNLWIKLIPRVTLLPEPAEWEPTMLLALALLPSAAWPIEIASAHWVYTGSKTEKGTPVMRIGKDIRTVRRVMYTLFSEDPEPRDKVQIICDCGNGLCINPLHAVAKVYKGQHSTLVSPPAVVLAADLDELVIELQSQFAMQQPLTFAELRARPVFEDWSEEDIRKAMVMGDLTVPD